MVLLYKARLRTPDLVIQRISRGEWEGEDETENFSSLI